ncbi:MAG: AAA family ATPase [Pyrinomonadaceae bacterium]
MKNPFEFGRELDAGELVNRTEEIQIVLDTIANSGKLFIIGPRRFGKTSLLKAVAQISEKGGNLVVRINAESFSSVNSLVEKLLELTAAQIGGTKQVVGNKIKEYFSSLNPEISFSVSQTEWKVSLGMQQAIVRNEVSDLLVSALDALNRLAFDQSSKVALIIDEFQELLSFDSDAEKKIRSAIQTHRNCAYIFASSKTRMLTEMVLEPSRPFYRMGQTLYLGKIPRPEFVRFLVDEFERSNFFDPSTSTLEKRDLVLKIIEVAHDVPFNVQMLAHGVWNALVQKLVTNPGVAFITEEVIENVLLKIVKQSDPFYTQIWKGIPVSQRKALSASVKNQGRNLLGKETIHTMNLSASTMQRALESLINRDILREKEVEGKIKYEFEDPFFSKWIELFTN